MAWGIVYVRYTQHNPLKYGFSEIESLHNVLVCFQMGIIPSLAKTI